MPLIQIFNFICKLTCIPHVSRVNFFNNQYIKIKVIKKKKVMAENFHNLAKETNLGPGSPEFQIKEIQRLTPRHIIKLSKVKDKERTVKTAREEQLVTHKGPPLRLWEIL